MSMLFYLSIAGNFLFLLTAFVYLATLLGRTPLNRVKHIKRGSTYEVYGIGMIQTSIPLSDYDKVFIYKDIETEEWWVRREAEFTVDRFTPCQK